LVLALEWCKSWGVAGVTPFAYGEYELD
jgi:hypothetical protein